ncbi:MAG: EFR1 family ferrodoxin [Chloroflexota bacterium]|nr:EFR1 family ferrodoxin [Chloroflexota bacterium]
MKPYIMVAYCSPSGSTRQVVDVIKTELKRLGYEAIDLDLGKERDWTATLNRIEMVRGKLCLFIGSPVYVSRAVPPVMEFIAALPEVTNSYAVPFAVWGGVTSGVCLWEMGEALSSKGFTIAGAAKVTGSHSLMWRSENPVGQGHPDEDDDDVMRKLVSTVYKRINDGHVRPIGIETLDYQPEPRVIHMKKTVLRTALEQFPQKTVDQEKCTQCGICQEECPTNAITLIPYPEFSDSCFACFSCVRLCPEDAIEADLVQLEQLIRKNAEAINERPLTQAFI